MPLPPGLLGLGSPRLAPPTRQRICKTLYDRSALNCTTDLQCTVRQICTGQQGHVSCRTPPRPPFHFLGIRGLPVAHSVISRPASLPHPSRPAGERLEPLRYYELLEKDVVRLGQSTREYVLLHDNSGDD